jgi:hypothetical protein
MSELLTATATRPPAFRDRDRGPTDPADPTDPTDSRSERRRARLWTFIEALAYAGAFIDPSGILAVQRLRQAQEEETRRARN